MLLDSNVIIYAARPEHSALRKFIEAHAAAVSIISQIEVLGYHYLRPTWAARSSRSRTRRWAARSARRSASLGQPGLVLRAAS